MGNGNLTRGFLCPANMCMHCIQELHHVVCVVLYAYHITRWFSECAAFAKRFCCGEVRLLLCIWLTEYTARCALRRLFLTDCFMAPFPLVFSFYCVDCSLSPSSLAEQYSEHEYKHYTYYFLALFLRLPCVVYPCLRKPWQWWQAGLYRWRGERM